MSWATLEGMVLRRLLARRALKRKRPGYWGAFGGHWTDRRDARERLERKRADGKVSEDEAQLLSGWIEQGYAIVRGAVPASTIDAINAEIERAWERSDKSYKLEIGAVYHDLRPELRRQPYKLLDLYARSVAAREAAFAPQVQRFLELVFERDPLLFQSLSFETGSGQPMHQDTAYVVVSSPVELMASWIALEDCVAGSGELQYYPGSQRMPEFLFAGGKNWNQERDGADQHERFLASVHERAQAQGLELTSFLPKKGDVLFWSADLAHGGSPILNRKATRRSLVCHYCPRDVQPYYFSYKPRHRRILRHGEGCHYASSYYEL